MTIGNRFELIDAQELQGQDVLNVYYYKQVGGATGTAADLITQFAFFVLPEVKDIQSDQLLHVALACRNLDVPTDFSVLPLVPGQPGSYVQAAEPVFVAASFVMQRQSLLTRNGRKRYAGVPDNEITNGIPSPGYLINLATLAAAIDDTLVGGSGNSYEPVIMKKLYDAGGNLIGYQDFSMGAASFVKLGTQNTRKP